MKFALALFLALAFLFTALFLLHGISLGVFVGADILFVKYQATWLCVLAAMCIALGVFKRNTDSV